MSNINRAMLVGRLGQDPQPRQGKGPATLSVAASDHWKDKATGERKEITDWHRVVIFNDNLAEFAEKHLRKGMMVYVVGKMKTRKYQKDGRDCYTTEVVLANFGAELQALESIGGGGPPPATAEDYGYSGGGTGSSLSDDYQGPSGPPDRGLGV